MTTMLKTTEAGLVTPKQFRDVLGHYPTGVTVITARDAEGRPIGMTIGSFTSISLEPALVGFFPARSSSTFPAIGEYGSFCVNIVADAQHDLCSRFAGPADDRFDGLAWHEAPSGAPIIDDALAWIDCSIKTVSDAGDHVLVIGRVNDLQAHPAAQTAGSPLIFHRGGLGSFQPLSRTVD